MRPMVLAVAFVFCLKASLFAEAPAGKSEGTMSAAKTEMKKVTEGVAQDVKDITREAEKRVDAIKEEVKEQVEQTKESVKEVGEAAKQEIKKVKKAVTKDKPGPEKK